MKARDNYGNLTGIEKAALLMLSLPEEHATKVFTLLDDSEIKEISQAMTALGKVTPTVVEHMFRDFVDQISTTGSLIGSMESTERLLSKVLSKDKVDSLLDEMRGPAGRTMWDKLGNVNEEMLANYLKNEYPQTIAVVLSRIRSDHAAKVLNLLPDSLAMEVIMRILRMESVQKEVLDEIERTLRTEFMNNLARSTRRDTHEMVADIFNHLDRASETKFLNALEERNADSAERVKNLMFTFEDLVKINNSGIQTLIRVLDKNRLGLALKGASDSIKDLFFKNMSERAAKIMKEDMAALGMVRVRDVDEAQSYVLTTAKELGSRGEIMIQSGKDAGDQLIG
jgi:flagellar motor switch protein FliG